jgi:hypothetical protein
MPEYNELILMTHRSRKTRTIGKYAPDSKEFHLKEYECLRKEVELLIEERKTLERSVVVAIGVSWAWLFHERSNIPPWTWLIPCLFAVLGLARAYGISLFFRSASAYFMTIEDAFFKPEDPVGWVHFTIERRWTRISTIAFWSILIAFTGIVATYEIRSRVAHTVPISLSETPKPSSNPQKEIRGHP